MFTLDFPTLTYRNCRCSKFSLGLQSVIRFGADYYRKKKREDGNDCGRFAEQRAMQKAEPSAPVFRFRMNESCEREHRDKK